MVTTGTSILVDESDTSMKNIQVIDGAMNSTFEIYAIPDDLFEALFPDGADIAFADDLEENLPGITELYSRSVLKKQVVGIHGTLHLSLSNVDRKYFPTRREKEVINKARSLKKTKRRRLGGK